MRRLIPALLAAAAASCAPVPLATVAPPPLLAPGAPAAGLDRVIGQTAPALVALFGTPDQDRREGTARRLQFVGAACVLDAYLYPAAAGTEPQVRHVDARLPSGDDFDRASCVAALSRR